MESELWWWKHGSHESSSWYVTWYGLAVFTTSDTTTTTYGVNLSNQFLHISFPLHHFLPSHHDFCFPVSSVLPHSIYHCSIYPVFIIYSLGSSVFYMQFIDPLPPVTVVVKHLDRLFLKLQLYFVSLRFLYCNTTCWDAYQCGCLVHWLCNWGQPRISIWCVSSVFHTGPAEVICAVSMNGNTSTRQQ